MGETINGEFAAYQLFRDAGIQYLDLLSSHAATSTRLIEARNRFMSARNEWRMRTAQVDGRVAMIQMLARAA
jgi:hypothetical protein